MALYFFLMNVQTVIRSALELLKDEKNWISINIKSLALDEHGYHVSPSSPKASQWSLFGAISKFCNRKEDLNLFWEVMDFLATSELSKFSSEDFSLSKAEVHLERDKILEILEGLIKDEVPD